MVFANVYEMNILMLLQIQDQNIISLRVPGEYTSV